MVSWHFLNQSWVLQHGNRFPPVSPYRERRLPEHCIQVSAPDACQVHVITLSPWIPSLQIVEPTYLILTRNTEVSALNIRQLLFLTVTFPCAMHFRPHPSSPLSETWWSHVQGMCNTPHATCSDRVASVTISLVNISVRRLQYLVSKMEFTVLNSPKGFWRSLPQRSHSFLDPNLKTWLPTHWCPSPLHSQGWMSCKQQSDILTVYQTQFFA
jgi:hypothetical protein